MAAGITASLQATGVLDVVGTGGADQFFFQKIGKQISINGVDGSWSAKAVKSIVIDLQAGDDIVSIDSLANGGTKALKEKVTVISGTGEDQVQLSTGEEVTFGAQGQQLYLVPGAAPQLNGTALNLSSSIVASLKSGVLSVTGTNNNDNILFRQTSGKVYVSGVKGAWSLKKVKSIVVNLQDGNDSVSVDSVANGGNQQLAVMVTVKSGVGTSTVNVATGHTVTLGGIGHTAVVRPDGTATLDGVAVNWENPPAAASLGGVAWEDHNGNGVRDAVDQGLAGWHILVNGVDRATTDANGNWSVANLAAGAYTVQQVAQSGWNVTSGGAGYTVNASSGSDQANLGFGEFKLISLSGSSWEDHNGNGVRDAVDQGLAGWHILVNGVDRATTDANGNWSVANLAAGAYTVQQVAQSGWNVTSGGAGYTVNASSGSDQANLSFGEFNTSTPSGTWFDANVLDAALRSLGNTLYIDGLLDRNDMLALFASAEDGDAVDATEFSDLQAIVNNTALFGTSESVWKLSSYIVSGNTANAKYQGQTLGNLVAGSSATQLANLVNKWYLGLDRPATPYGYALASGTLFVNGPSYSDIDQGSLNNCAFMASLAETALRSPSTINSMFVVNGDGTYAVRFYHSGVAEYVTVDSYLPGGGGVYAGLPNGELWGALAEKAYAQVVEMSWFGNKANAYTSIQNLFAYNTLKHITGQLTVGLTGTSWRHEFEHVRHGLQWRPADLSHLVRQPTHRRHRLQSRLCSPRLRRRQPDRDPVQSVGN